MHKSLQATETVHSTWSEAGAFLPEWELTFFVNTQVPNYEALRSKWVLINGLPPWWLRW